MVESNPVKNKEEEKENKGEVNEVYQPQIPGVKLITSPFLSQKKTWDDKEEFPISSEI